MAYLLKVTEKDYIKYKGKLFYNSLTLKSLVRDHYSCIRSSFKDLKI